MSHTSTATDLTVRSAISEHVDPVMGGEAVCEAILDASAPNPLRAGAIDLAVLMIGGQHAGQAQEIARTVRETLGAGVLIGVTAEGVIGDAREVEDRGAVSLLCASLPGAVLSPFLYKDLPHAVRSEPSQMQGFARAIGATADLRSVLFFGDPFSVPLAGMVEAFSAVPQVVPGLERCAVVGGMASAGRVPGQNTLILNGKHLRTGGVGVSISGRVRVDHLVSQGCRPIGEPLVVTATKRNIIQQLGGKSALEAAREQVSMLSPDQRGLLSNGLFMGRVINEYKDRFGRGDFLIRNILKVDPQSGAIAVGDGLKVGQTVQFHVRDGLTAHEDLALLLEAQKQHGPAAGGLVCSCSSRGRGMFPDGEHDAMTIRAALGEDFALAGFYANGEIGPIGDRSFVHGHTASMAIFREYTSSYPQF